MKAVITVVGKDTVGILAKVSTVCSEFDANVIEVSQSVLQDMFAMIMLVDMRKKNFKELSSSLDKLGEENNLKIHSMHEDIFNSMHRI
jgi:ACT domain-containing protein